MSDEQITDQIEQIERVTKEISKNKEIARKFLRDAGIPVGDEPFEDKKKVSTHA